MNDLITKKKISTSAAAYPDKRQAETGLVLPGLTLVHITSMGEFEDALTLCTMNAKLK